jgi:hypothetical protein
MMALTLPLKIDESALGLIDLSELDRLYNAVRTICRERHRKESPRYEVKVACADREAAKRVVSVLVGLGRFGHCVRDDVKVIYESSRSPNCWSPDDVDELLNGGDCGD